MDNMILLMRSNWGMYKEQLGGKPKLVIFKPYMSREKIGKFVKMYKLVNLSRLPKQAN